jgi:protease I
LPSKKARGATVLWAFSYYRAGILRPAASSLSWFNPERSLPADRYTVRQIREKAMPFISESRILIMATHGFEQSELVKPLEQLKAKGAKVEVAAPEAGQIKGWRDNNWGTPVDVDLTLDAVKVGDYEALVLPGGVMNPDKLRINDKALAIVKAFVDSGKVVAAIYHTPWLLVETGAVKDREVTSFVSIRTNLINAGGR